MSQTNKKTDDIFCCLPRYTSDLNDVEISPKLSTFSYWTLIVRESQWEWNIFAIANILVILKCFSFQIQTIVFYKWRGKNLLQKYVHSLVLEGKRKETQKTCQAINFMKSLFSPHYSHISIHSRKLIWNEKNSRHLHT